MKAKSKRLQLKKLKVAKISNMGSIKGGSDSFSVESIHISCLTTNPRESVRGNNCESQNCEDIFE